MTTPIIIDTDPGQDDAVAILLALASPELDVLGITTVAGNVPLATTTRNALTTVELADRPCAVRAGCDRPLTREPVTAEIVSNRAWRRSASPPSLTKSLRVSRAKPVSKTARRAGSLASRTPR